MTETSEKERSIGPDWLYVIHGVTVRARFLAYQGEPHSRIANVLDGMDFVLDQLMLGKKDRAYAYLLEMTSLEPALADLRDRVLSLAP